MLIIFPILDIMDKLLIYKFIRPISDTTYIRLTRNLIIIYHLNLLFESCLKYIHLNTKTLNKNINQNVNSISEESNVENKALFYVLRSWCENEIISLTMNKAKHARWCKIAKMAN